MPRHRGASRQESGAARPCLPLPSGRPIPDNAIVASREPPSEDEHPIRVLDVVALTVDLPEQDLRRGQVGTVVEQLAPDTFEVEFSDDEGRAYAMLALRADQLLVLNYRPAPTP